MTVLPQLTFPLHKYVMSNGCCLRFSIIYLLWIEPAYRWLRGFINHRNVWLWPNDGGTCGCHLFQLFRYEGIYSFILWQHKHLVKLSLRQINTVVLYRHFVQYYIEVHHIIIIPKAKRGWYIFGETTLERSNSGTMVINAAPFQEKNMLPRCVS